MSTLSTQTAPLSKAAASEGFERYGVLHPKGTSLLAIELWAYATNRGAELGGLGAERHFRNAFKMAWPKFIWHDWMEMLMTAWCNEEYITVIGHSRATKTYGAAHLCYLDYCADPFQTWTSLTTTSFDGLRSRMWSDLMAAVETAVFPCPFRITSTSNEMKLRVGDKASRKDDKFMIEGFATAEHGAGRIQGKHANRRRLGLDEAQELPDAIWTAEVNAGTAPDFKTVRLANPVDKQSRFGRECCEPEGGWGSIHDSDLSWRAKNGRLVLHFDGLQNHNYKLYIDMGRGAISKEEYEKRKLPFMLSAEYIEQVRVSPGEDSLEWWMYVRGFFPGDGLVARAFPDVFIERMKPDVVFDFPPTRCAVMDPAYEFDNCVVHFFDYGKKAGKWFVRFVRTHTINVKVMADRTGEGGQTKDEQIAEAVQVECVKEGVKPGDFAQDRTGNGRSVYSHLSKNWGRAVVGVEFGGKPTDRPLGDSPTNDAEGKPMTCQDLFKYFVDELHFRAAAWAQAGQVGGVGDLDARTLEDLAARRYFVVKKQRRVETKAELKKRLGRSPDFGDAFIIFAELLARKGIMPEGGSGPVGGDNDVWAEARKRALKACNKFHGETSFGF